MTEEKLPPEGNPPDCFVRPDWNDEDEWLSNQMEEWLDAHGYGVVQSSQLDSGSANLIGNPVSRPTVIEPPSNLCLAKEKRSGG
jgi:hypothetical protein